MPKNTEYKIRGHESFFIRKGWLNKGLRIVSNAPRIFVDRSINPMDVFGIGSNMVKSLRYWMQATGLTRETKVTGQELTDIGKLVYENDKYLEEMGTLWILQYMLASNKKMATSWYYFFNEFKLTEFNRDDFILHFSNYLRIEGIEIAERSLEDDFNCIINTYVPRIKSNPSKVLPENNIDCPFGELGLIDIVSKKEKIYRKQSPAIDSINPLIILAFILKQADGREEIKITDLQNGINGIGKIFNLDHISMINILYKLEIGGYIKVNRTAGLDVVKIKTELQSIDCLAKYYQQINNR